MQKPTLRPYRLVNNKTNALDSQGQREENEAVENNKKPGSLIEPLDENTEPVIPGAPVTVSAEKEARLLLKRTPGSYLLNQIYGLWVFGSLFLLTVLVTRNLSVAEYGVFAISLSLIHI